MISLRRAIHDDARLLYEWRNDPLSRAMSINQGSIAWEEHVSWFDRVLADPAYTVLVGLDSSGREVGVVRFQQAEGGAIVSISVAPEHRGKGLSKPLLTEAVGQFQSDVNIPVIATISPKNAASLSIFQGCGFEFSQQVGEFETYVFSPRERP